ncbi:hypothetical protein KC660_01495 [Candidatus Dojkabacteria bacterium]|uniref:Uncharacterized protein n=1 Tax=Candidatus Dojkabacteria bacterium TaxID=2099670 RepID=A0A955RHV2_9BACT|nr:hypothetical protein [Candidatus Dojkabacteria bacterium]
MKRTLYFLPIIIVTAILIYYLSRTLSPYDSNAQLDLKNISIMEGLLFVLLSSVFGLIFAVIDKLIFKKYYQAPNYRFALRQGFALSFFAIANIHLKIIDDWNLIIFALTGIAYLGFLIYDVINSRNKDRELEIEEETTNKEK